MRQHFLPNFEKLAPRLTSFRGSFTLRALWFSEFPAAQVVKLVDTLASGASARKGVEVQVLSWAPLIAKYSAYLSQFNGTLYAYVTTKVTTNA